MLRLVMGFTQLFLDNAVSLACVWASSISQSMTVFFVRSLRGLRDGRNTVALLIIPCLHT